MRGSLFPWLVLGIAVLVALELARPVLATS